MNNDPKVEQIFTAIEQLREAGNNGPRVRKLLDRLFRDVHNIKAIAAANNQPGLASAAHEFENVLQSLRTANAALNVGLPDDLWNSLKQEQKHALHQSLAEGAKLFLIETNFDVADFDRQFQSLRETLNKNGEVISTSPKMADELVNFKILYAQRGDLHQTLPQLVYDAAVEEISVSVADATNELEMSLIERAFEDLRVELIKLPTVTTDSVLQQALRAGRAAAEAASKEVEFEVRGEDLLTDKSLCENISYPLLHLVRNAVDHGIETRGKIVIEVARLANQIVVRVIDDGRGIYPELLPLIFRPGFSTATAISDISGRGVGLDVVKTTIEEIGGSIKVTSQPGKGSTFELIVPF